MSPLRRQKIKILFLAANPVDTEPVRLDHEARGIKEALGGANINCEVQTAVRTRDIPHALRRFRPNFVHFSGHGERDNGIVVENTSGHATFVPKQALAELFRIFEGVKCVVFNSCYSREQAEIVAKHVPFVIGMSQEISDEAAIEFAFGFYQAIRDGEEVARAFEYGKLAVGLSYDIANEFAVPVLFYEGREYLRQSSRQSGEAENVSGAPLASPSHNKEQGSELPRDKPDNWRLSEAEPTRLISVDDWTKLGWKRFQDLILEYLNAQFGRQAAATIVATSSGGPDGGRDFELTFVNPYRRWRAFVECKNHKDSLGLDTLGKYLVVVIVNHVEELFVISSSPITRAARAQFVQAACSTRVQVSLVDGSYLDGELLRHPHVLAKYFPHIVAPSTPNESPDLQVTLHITPFPEVDPSSLPNSARVKLYDAQFYLHLILKNLSTAPLTDIDIQISQLGNYIALRPLAEHEFPARALAPLQDASVVYNCHLRVPQDEIRIDTIRIKYRRDATIHEIQIAPPLLDFTSLSSPPLVGQSLIKLISERVPQVAADVSSGQSRLLDIRGASGVGKSRLLDEICGRFRDAGFLCLRYDAIRMKDGVFRRLFADLASLPIYKGSLTFATSQIAELLRARGCSPDFGADMASFLIEEDWSHFYSIAECFKQFFRGRGRGTAIILDNIQEISPKALQLLLLLGEFLYENEACICLVLATNTEIMPSGNIAPLGEFLDRLDSFCLGVFRVRHDIEPLSDADAKLLLYSILHSETSPRLDSPLAAEDAVINTLVNKAGTRPLDLIMAVRWLEETGILLRRGALTWFIRDFDRLAEAVRMVPRGSAELIRKRLKAISQGVDAICWQDIHDHLQYLVAFSGRIPTVFASHLLSSDATEVLLDRSILRFESELESLSLVAFHDNIFRYLESSPTWAPRRQQSDIIIKWLANQHASVREELALVHLFNAINSGKQSTEVLTISEHVISRSRGHNPGDVREVGSRLKHYLCNAKLDDVDFQRYFALRVHYADALLHQAAISESLKEFEELYRHIRAGVLTRADARDRFYHKFINANLHSAQCQRALAILDERRRDPPTDPEFKFLMYDRYGVAYTALGDVGSAETWLSQALTEARATQRPDWESIAHYDRAYVHVHITFDKQKTVESFQLSLDAFERSSDKPPWRRIEKHSMCALISLIEYRLEDAINEVEAGLWLSKRENALYSHIKLQNLLGVCKILAGRFEEAHVAFELGRSHAAMSFNARAFWRAIANLGALAALENGPSAALDYFIEVERYLREMLTDKRMIVRELPILANYIALHSELDDQRAIEEILDNWGDERLRKFARQLSIRQPRSRRQVLGIVQYGGFGFLPT